MLQQKLICFTMTDPSGYQAVWRTIKFAEEDCWDLAVCRPLQIMFIILDTWSVKLHRSVFEKNGLIFMWIIQNTMYGGKKVPTRGQNCQAMLWIFYESVLGSQYDKKGTSIQPYVFKFVYIYIYIYKLGYL